MNGTVTLYSRATSESGIVACEWCGRPGQQLALRVEGGEIEFADPSLCEVCQALLGVLDPHQSRFVPPSRDRDGQAQMFADARNWAQGTVLNLLTQRYNREGKPRPDWLA